MTIQEQYENLEKTVRGYNPAADFQHIRAAFEFAAEAHKDQKRKSGEPYIIHPLAVSPPQFPHTPHILPHYPNWHYLPHSLIYQLLIIHYLILARTLIFN